MPPAYDIHPEFGYFCPTPRARRELRVAVVSILAGMAIGATIMAIHAGQAAETDAVSGNAQLKSSAPDPLAAVPAASPRIKDADNAKADPVETIKPYPIRMVRVRSSKAPSPLAGIPLGRTEPPEPPASAGPASPENAEAPGSPAALLRAQSVAAAEPAVSGAVDRSLRSTVGCTRARRRLDSSRSLTDALTAAGEPLLFGIRLWASVCLALFVAFWLELDNPFWAGYLRGDRVPAAARRFAAQGLVPDDRHRDRRHNDRGADRVLSAGSDRLSRAPRAVGRYLRLRRHRAAQLRVLLGGARRLYGGDYRRRHARRDRRRELRTSSCWRSGAPARSASGSRAPASSSPGPISAAPSGGWQRHSPIWRPRSRADLPARWHWRGRNCRTRKPSDASSSGASSRSIR